MPSIRFITTNAGQWGGSESLWQQSALSLAEAGHPVVARVPKSVERSKYLQRLTDQGVSVPQLTLSRSLGTRIISRLGLGKSVQKDTLNDAIFDLNVVSQGSLTEGLHVLERLQAEKTRYAVVVQLVSEFQRPSDEAGERLAKAFHNAKIICFVSEHNRLLAERQIGPLPNATVVRNPFLVPYDEALPYPSTENGLRIGVVARLHAYHKGHDLLFDVLKQPKWKTRNLQVHLFGDGPNERSLKREVERMGLSGKVFFRGHQTSISAIWSECHASLLCSRIEGLPLSLVEAMLSARCPIITDVGGAVELVRDEENGFVAPYANVRDIDETLERAWARRSEWQELGNRAAMTARSILPLNPARIFADRLLKLAQN